MIECCIFCCICGMDIVDGVGVKFKCIIGQFVLDMFDLFLLLDEFCFDQVGDYIVGFFEYLYCGFEMVIYMFVGYMQYGDNYGNCGDLGFGSVQWMIVGCGILYLEMLQQENGLMWGFQLWVNLFVKDKMIVLCYQDIVLEKILVVQLVDGVEVCVIVGDFGGVSGLVSGVVIVLIYFDFVVQLGVMIIVLLLEGYSVFVYVFEGEVVQVVGELLVCSELVVLICGELVSIVGGIILVCVLLVVG